MKQLLIAIALVIGFSGVAKANEYQVVKYVSNTTGTEIYTEFAKHVNLNTVAPGIHKFNVTLSCGKIWGLTHTIRTTSMIEIKDNKYRYSMLDSGFVGSGIKVSSMPRNSKHYKRCIAGVNKWLNYMNTLLITSKDF